MTQEEYLIAEAKRYFPYATTLSIAFNGEDGNITITMNGLDFVCEPGPDDEWYTFLRDYEGHMTVFTIPLEPDDE